MIRTLTIVENRTEDGKVEYEANGSLPIDEAARALVILSFNAGAQKQAEMQAQVVAKLEAEKKEPEKNPTSGDNTAPQSFP